jgi:hypothetical protein
MPHPDHQPDDDLDAADEAEFDAGEEILAELLEAGATDPAVLADFYREVGADTRDRPWRMGHP